MTTTNNQEQPKDGEEKEDVTGSGEENPGKPDASDDSGSEESGGEAGEEIEGAKETIEDAKAALEKGDKDEAQELLGQVKQWLDNLSNSTTTAIAKLETQVNSLAEKIQSTPPTPSPKKSPPQSPDPEQPKASETTPPEPEAQNQENADGQGDQKTRRQRRRAI